MSKEEISNNKPNNSTRKDFAKNGSLSIIPTPEEMKAWEDGGKAKIHQAIKESHRKMQTFVNKRASGEPFYIDKRGNG